MAARVFRAEDHRPSVPDGKFRVVLVTSGSVASVKLPLIVAELIKVGSLTYGAAARRLQRSAGQAVLIPKTRLIEVQVVATQASLHFYTQQAVDEAVGEVGRVRVWTDKDEWSDWKAIGDPILHIELRRWADMVVVAPCSADMLAKIAAGFSDNLALSMLRALDPTTPVVLCPAMNTHMYQHPFTAQHLAKVQADLKYEISGPQGAGLLACGDEGPGKMTDWREIVDIIKERAGV